ncbi:MULTISPECIES: condensation protein [Bacillus cereus group]|uniref:Condensation protein n=2 Tax=Bacillus cereus group TaxID=86661 RepID=A0A1C4EZ38_BACTU|nr:MULTISPECIES: condensation protein [Bacillus cereus group]MCC2323951.1 condensation protein [Bacillus wiedmannii]MED2013231.1 condensation protein [Bacillus wiedmannii]MED3025442.1 condensation protein [Bacillus wiedmannii]OTY00060.1 condensation protein [Bacillus thuringiensis serovar wratislaviensis]OUB60561.1 condensation protein [Bacillus thuringiensis serovar sylvestriensis]
MEQRKYSVTPQDRMNYILGLYSANQQINAVLYFPIGISKKVLEQSVRITLQLQPVLNSRFVESDMPYWEEHSSSTNSPICFFAEGDDQNLEVMAIDFIKESGDPIQGPMVQTKLLRGTSTNILVVKLSHLCSDGAGVKEYINLLGAIYTHLSLGQSKDEIIKRFNAKNEGFRDQSPVFKYTGITDIKSAYRPSQEQQAALWSFPSQPNKNAYPKIAVRRLSREQTLRLTLWTKAQQATLNDAILTAYFRSLSHFAVYAEPRTAEKMVGLTIDLRRYLPNHTTGSICNLSGMEMPVIKMENDDSFNQTLVRVKESMDTIKSQNPGLSSAAGMELLASKKLSEVKEMYKQQYERALQMGMALPLLTNFGSIADEPIKFGEVQAQDGYITSPIMYAPFFTMGASSYNGRLTFTIGYHSPDTTKKKVEQFLESVVNELSKL